jgi:hypothetical protein
MIFHLRLNIFYLAHACILDMDEYIHVSLVYLWYIILEYTRIETSG